MVEEKGNYFHVYNQGHQEKNIFLAEEDYFHYLRKLREYSQKKDMAVICYCLLPNHLHLILRPNSQEPIYRLIQSLHTSYSMYFNQKYNKQGQLFRGRFKKKKLAREKDLLYLSSFIHLKPVINGLVKEPADYQWSSYQDYIGLRKGTLCYKKPVLMDYSPDWYKQITENEVKERLIQKEFINLIKNYP